MTIKPTSNKIDGEMDRWTGRWMDGWIHTKIL